MQIFLDKLKKPRTQKPRKPRVDDCITISKDDHVYCRLLKIADYLNMESCRLLRIDKFWILENCRLLKNK